MNAILAQYGFILVPIVKVAILVFVVLTLDAYLTLLERKVIAHIQARWGPYRTGPHGLLQPLADGVKFILKEDPTPEGVDRKAYFFAPFLTLMLALTSLAVIPFGPDIKIFGYTTNFGIADVNISLLALFAITALSVYGIALAGWGSNSKYSLLGGLRSSAQMISYELGMTLSVVGVLLIAGTLSLKEIVEMQNNHGILGWNIIGFSKDGFGFTQIIGCLCFFIAAIAETNRVPFDLPEAESELVAGYHTEYSSMKFAMFFIGEYTAMITVSSLSTILFFGGWLSPFPASWTLTHYLPSVILIPLGLWVFFDGIRYETIFGRVVLPGIGSVLIALGAALFLLPSAVNEIIQGPFWFFLKVFAALFFYIWMRATLPRLRYDQLMDFGWKILLPVSIANVVLTSAFILWRMHG